MFKTLFKILMLAIIVFCASLAYDLWQGNTPESLNRLKPVLTTNQQKENKNTSKGNNSENIKSNQQVTSGPSLEERKVTKHERSAIKSIFLAILPERTTWPTPLQKAYILFNVEDVIEPLREKPNWVKLSQMNRDIPQAVIAIEDHNFYNHGAIAMESIIRAFLVNLSAGEVVQGGSTISQQLVKNVFLTQEQTMSRKAEEVLLALMLEHQYTKDEILEMYLNTTYLGAGATGIKQASRVYFDKAPGNLTLAEAAVIASLPYAPSALNPLQYTAACKKRQLLVLQEMQRYGFISQTQYNEAKSQSIWLANGKKM